MALTQIKAAALTADLIDETKLADNSIDSEHYNDGSIDTAHIADSQVTTAKIADTAVTTAKITDGNVTTAKVAADAITGAKIADNAVGAEHIESLDDDLQFITANGETTRIKSLPTDGTYSLGSSGGAAIAIHRIADGAAGSEEIAFETHHQGNSHAERVRIDKDGNVGIGTNDPTMAAGGGLHVRGPSGSQSRLHMTTSNSGDTGSDGFYIIQEGAESSSNDTNFINYETANMKFSTGGTERMRISSGGIITQPYKPSFFATINGGDNTTNSGGVVPFDQTKHNTGSHFDTSTNKFIAPVAGVYYFCTQIWAKNGTSNMRFRFAVDDASNSYATDYVTQNGFHGNSVNREDFGYNASIVYYLDVGDRIYLAVDNTNLTYYTAGASDPHTYFCGYLIG